MYALYLLNVVLLTPQTVEQNVKNASSWSSLAQASSPQSAAGSSMKSAARDSFQAFKKQAKEKQDRVSSNIVIFLNFLNQLYIFLYR